MAFFVKNISITSISVHGIILDVNSKVDLTLTVSNADIITSLLSGELFDKITGRALAIVDISTLRTLGATTNELSTFARIGYFQGRLGVEDFKDPFTFNADGYLMTTASIGDITVESQSEVEGRVLDGASAAGIKPVIIAGVDEAGNAQNLIVNSDGYLMTSTAISIETNSEVEGRVADGASAAGVKPVIIAGVDEAGNAQNLIVNSDGYLMTSTAISVETTSEVEGRVLDGASAAGIKPVIVAGVDSDGYAQNIQTDGYGNIIISKASFSDITVKSQSEVEGRVLDGSSAAGIKPVIISGVDGSGNVQSLLTDVNGKLETTAATSSSWFPNYSTTAGDGYSVRASDTTITFTGPTITTSQLRTVIVDTGSAVSIYEQGKNSVRLSISGTTITVSGAGVTPIPAGSTVDVMWVGQDKAYDSSSQTIRSFPVIDLASRRVDTPVALIAAAQNITNAWADLGPEIALSGYTRVSIWLSVDINDGYNVRVRCLGKHTAASALEYVMPILKPNTATDGYFAIYAEDEYIELNDDMDQNIMFTWVVENTIPYVQFQVMAVTPGAGAGQAQIDNAQITYAWGG